MKSRLVRLLFDKDLTADRYKVAISLIAYLFVFCFICRYAVEIPGGGNVWKTGDWLINYEGGWIRRGLMGQVLYAISGFGISLLWMTFFLQASIYFSTAYLVLKLFFSTRREISWLLFVFSPAFIFLFPFYDMQGGFRKEIMVFLSFCLMAVGTMHGRFSQRHLIPSFLLYAIAVFSHEAMVLCVVFFIYLLFERTRSEPDLWKIGKIYVAGFCIVAAAGLLFAISHRGTADASGVICESLQHRGLNPDICRGAVDWLGFDVRHAWNQVNLTNYVLAYPPLFLLAVAPLLLTDWWKRKLPVLLTGFLFLAPLFVVAIDWGRWIHIYSFMIFVLLLFDSSNSATKIYKLPLVVVAVYGGFWSIPHFTATGLYFGMFSLAYRIVHRLLAMPGTFS